jgi:predicted AAA+ superfamily ATPase
LFENLIIAEAIKKSLHKGKELSFYFWQNKTGHEVDLVFDYSNKPSGAEIKSGKTFQDDFLKNIE